MQTGGNFGGFKSLFPNYYDLSFPIGAIATDGTSVIQSHGNQNGTYVYPFIFNRHLIRVD